MVDPAADPCRRPLESPSFMAYEPNSQSTGTELHVFKHTKTEPTPDWNNPRLQRREIEIKEMLPPGICGCRRHRRRSSDDADPFDPLGQRGCVLSAVPATMKIIMILLVDVNDLSAVPPTMVWLILLLIPADEDPFFDSLPSMRLILLLILCRRPPASSSSTPVEIPTTRHSDVRYRRKTHFLQQLNRQAPYYFHYLLNISTS